ncbi:hypothetical protein P7C70_g3928, partial [Phenoliferia sp. Uapishka_3]
MPIPSAPVATIHFAIPPSRLGCSVDKYLDPSIGPSWPQEPFEVKLGSLRDALSDEIISPMEQLETRGFAVMKHKSETLGTLENADSWNADYLKETSELLKAQLGATEVFIWNSVSRSSDPKVNQPYGANHFQKEAIKGLQFGSTIRGTAAGAHVDQDSSNSLRMCKVAAGDDVLEKYSRVQQLNLWRPISGPVTMAPLVVCDGRTVKATERSVHCGLFGTRTVIHHGTEQKWFYMPRQQVDEFILLKIYDSHVREGDALDVPHTGCDIHGFDGLERPRESIEVRVVAVYE